MLNIRTRLSCILAAALTPFRTPPQTRAEIPTEAFSRQDSTEPFSTRQVSSEDQRRIDAAAAKRRMRNQKRLKQPWK